MQLTPEQLRQRTKQFANRIIRLYVALLRRTEAQVIGKQLLRAETSVGANYRAVCRARSRDEFAAKLGIVIEEVDETVYWIELLEDNEIIRAQRLKSLLAEAHELTAIFTAARATTKGKRQGIS